MLKPYLWSYSPVKDIWNVILVWSAKNSWTSSSKNFVFTAWNTIFKWVYLLNIVSFALHFNIFRMDTLKTPVYGIRVSYQRSGVGMRRKQLSTLTAFMEWTLQTNARSLAGSNVSNLEILIPETNSVGARKLKLRCNDDIRFAAESKASVQWMQVGKIW